MRQNDKRALIIGCGSIGLRHAAILAEMGYAIGCVTQRSDVPWTIFRDIATALKNVQPQAVVIATRTADHKTAYDSVMSTGYTGYVLVEKPLFAQMPQTVPMCHKCAFVGYNLRFHPVVQAMRTQLLGKKIFSAQFSVGQYLPQWRPGTDYRQSYSARSAEGGGVLRDLSHELDLAQWLCGPLTNVAANIRRSGNLDIETEDIADVLASGKECSSVSIHLDYQNLFVQRTVSVQADGLSLFGDLVQNTLRTQNVTENFVINRNTTYKALWQDILTSQRPMACTFNEGLNIVRIIHAVESAFISHKWRSL